MPNAEYNPQEQPIKTPPSYGGPSRIRTAAEFRREEEAEEETRAGRELPERPRPKPKKSAFKKALPWIVSGGATAGGIGFSLTGLL